MFTRHGEKPSESGTPFGVDQHGEKDEHALSVRGWQRAGALAGLFQMNASAKYPGVVKPGVIYATAPSSQSHSTREFNTAEPLAKALGLAVNTDFEHGHEHKLVKHVLEQNENALVVWHHGEIPAALSSFAISNASEVPDEWPEERFDLIWVLTNVDKGTSYRFTSVNQQLLSGDFPA
jgi:broad specificity phosphatase PhoE